MSSDQRSSRAADVVIIGGGIIGGAIADALARRDAGRVILLEAGQELGTGATAKSTGGIRHQFSSKLNTQLTLRSIEVYERFEELTGQSIGLRRNGYLLVTNRHETLQSLERSVAMQGALGIPTRLVSPAEAIELFPYLSAKGLLGGSYCPLDGSGSPTDALQGFRAIARAKGIEIVLGERVKSVLIDAGQVVGVRSTSGDIVARTVVNAAGHGAIEVAASAGIDLPATAYRRQVFVAAPIASLPLGLPMLVDLDTGWYLHQEASGTILLGGTDARTRPGTVEEVDWDGFDAVATAASARVPEIADAVKIQTAFCGIRTVTPDHHPILGRTAKLDGYVSATACNGHGFMHAPAVGSLVAESVIDWAISSMPAAHLSLERFAGARVDHESVIF